MAGYFAKPPKGSLLNRADPLARGLLHALPFNEGAGGKALDLASGRAATWASGTETAPAWSAGAYGRGFSAGGQTRFATPDAGNIAAGDFTVRLVFTPRTWPGAYTNVISKGGAVGELALYVNTSGQFRYMTAGGGAGEVTPVGSMTAGGTHDFVVVRSAGSVQPYVNGLPVGSPFTAAGTAASAGSDLRVGWFDNDTPDLIYHLAMIWKGRALSATEARVLYADPFRMFRRGPMPVPLGFSTVPPGIAVQPTYKQFPRWFMRSRNGGTPARGASHT